MAKDWVKTNILELIAQINKFVTALNGAGGLAASGLTAPQLTALGAMATTLQADYTDQLAKQAAAAGAVDKTQTDQAAAAAELRNLGRAANGYSAMTDFYRDASGLTIRDTTPTPGDLPVVADLAVVGRPNGNNFLDWSIPAGIASGITWEIQAAPGVGQDFVIVGTTSRTDFLHESAGAGVHRLYRVVAKRGNRRGEPGNEAAVLHSSCPHGAYCATCR